MLSSLILSLLIASPSYKVQNHNSAYERKTADQIVRYLRQLPPGILSRVLRGMKWQPVSKVQPCPKKRIKKKTDLDWEDRMLIDLMLP